MLIHSKECEKGKLRLDRYRPPFTTIVLLKISYGLSVYAASSPELVTVQNFLRRCYKRSYISYPIDIYDLVEKYKYAIFDKARNSVKHTLRELLLKVKSTTHSLRKVGSLLPKVTERFKKCFMNRPIFKCKLASN